MMEFHYMDSHFQLGMLQTLHSVLQLDRRYIESLERVRFIDNLVFSLEEGLDQQLGQQSLQLILTYSELYILNHDMITNIIRFSLLQQNLTQSLEVI